MRVNHFPQSLSALATQRKGGTYNIRGIVYQVLYSVARILEEFSAEANTGKVFQLEGIEDLDYYVFSEQILSKEYIQLKCKDESIDADDFVKNILDNFLETYDHAPDSHFTLVSNVHLKGKLADLSQSKRTGKPLSPKTAEYWFGKITERRPHWNTEGVNYFISRLHFVRKMEQELQNEAFSNLIAHYSIVNGNEIRFFQALFYEILQRSRSKQTVTKQDIDHIIQQVFDDMAIGGENKAIKGGWIIPVGFQNRGEAALNDGYFEGKAARPFHIAANLPVERPFWEKEIVQTIHDFDVTVIKASSGQGKSTLAWRVARQLTEQGFSIYELNKIGEDGEEDVFRFIESRLKVGLVPLIVIDGLNERLIGWSRLAERVQILRGVKILITAREEDWFRYGQGVTRLILKPVTIQLDAKEAAAIYALFKKTNHIHPNAKDWRVAWEKIQPHKLLIEYIYLLTQGQMIQERLTEQLHVFRDEKEGLAKKQILRLVSVADVLGIRLPTVQLLNFVDSKTGFQCDMPTVLQSLKHEYHIQITDLLYVEGLHPIRSQHISDILHEALPINQTLIDLLSVIAPQSLFTLVSNAPFLLKSDAAKAAFFEQLAGVMALKSYKEITDVILGVFATDAYVHWQENKSVYDDLATQGLSLYITLKTPFSGLKKEDFEIINTFNPQFFANLEKIKEADLSKLQNTSLFLNALITHLDNQPLKPRLMGVTSIERWNERFNLRGKILKSMGIEDIEKVLDTSDLPILGEIIYYIYLTDKSLYQRFYERNGIRIIGLLREKTKSLTIEKQKKVLKMQYIVDSSNSVHNQSVDRVNQVVYCLPHFETFSISGIYFPNPLLKMYNKHDESIKNASWDGWIKYDAFNVKSNQVWSKTIEEKYQFSTYYEWQQYWVELREIIVDWMRQVIRLLESRMSKMEVFKKMSEQVAQINHQLAIHRKRELEIKYDDNLDKDEVNEVLKGFTEWRRHITNVLNQTVPNVDNTDGWRVYKLNCKSCAWSISSMQQSFENIIQRTAEYFDTSDLKAKEISTYFYFSDLIQFFYDEFHLKKRAVSHPRNEIKQWKEQKWQKELAQLQKVKEKLETCTAYEMLLPKGIFVESDFLDCVVIGMKYMTIQDFERDISLIHDCLSGLLEVNAQFFYLLFIDSDMTALTKCYRISDSSLKKLTDILRGSVETYDAPPIFSDVTDFYFNQLEGVTLAKNLENDPIKSAIFLLQEALWRYTEINKRIGKSETHLQAWKKQILSELQQVFDTNLKALVDTPNMFSKYKDLVNKITNNRMEFDESLCERYWYEDIVGKNN